MKKALFIAANLPFLSLCQTANTHANQQSREGELVSHAYSNDPAILAELLDMSDTNSEYVYRQDDYSSYYFKNLSSNFGYNAFGTCTYVAIAELLSFYDTYWCGAIIQNEYEKKAEFEGDFPQYTLNSPGVNPEDEAYVDSLSINEYYSYIGAKSDAYFQLKLIKLAMQVFGEFKFDTSFESFGMTQSEMVKLLEYYLYDYLPMTTNDIEVETESSNSETIKEFILAKIRNGIPVIVRTNDLGGHAFIAYDYDENTGELYAHAGLKDPETKTALTHVNLGEIDDINIWDATALNVKMRHSHSRNFISGSKSYCACTYLKATDITINSGNYRDMTPTYSWKSLYKEKWYKSYNTYYQVSFLDSSDTAIFSTDISSSNEFTLEPWQWESTLKAQGTQYKISIDLKSTKVSSMGLNLLSYESFDKPLEYSDIPHICPSEYGFADAYPADDQTKNTYTNHTTSDGFGFQTKRYRTGYIHNEYIVMSPIRKGINEAFIEYRFDTAITRLDVELSHWRELSNEKLESDTGTALFQQFINDKWVTILDLLSEEADLPHSRENIKLFTFEFEQPAYMIRFYSSSFTTNSNDSNRGRICIGDMMFYKSMYSMPPSGYEVEYDPVAWNNTIVPERNDRLLKRLTNCYSYALNAQINAFTNKIEPMQPGQSSSDYVEGELDVSSAYALTSAIKKDAENFGFGFKEIAESTRCRDGYYKVALAIGEGAFSWDYHWYRQNADGSWSHKRGRTDVRNNDASGNVVMSPRGCNRKYATCNYSIFIGYYEIKPLNIYYETSQN